jgi:hypothetical protein
LNKKKDVCGYFDEVFCHYHIRAYNTVKLEVCPTIKDLNDMLEVMVKRNE